MKMKQSTLSLCIKVTKVLALLGSIVLFWLI